MSETLQYQIRLHIIVLIFGFTGILGKLIELPANEIVVIRTLIASVGIGLFLLTKKVAFNVPFREWFKWLLTGFIVGLHWYFFFESIKLSTVSIALVSFSSTALFTSILEPLVLKKKIFGYEIFFSILIMIGMFLVLSFEFKYAMGIFYGIIGAFLASLFTVLNSKYVLSYRPSLISFYELIGGAFVIIVLSIGFGQKDTLTVAPSIPDWIYLLLLAIVATAFAFVVSVQVMKKLTPFTVSLTINLEPLYGILLSIIIFGEEEMMSVGSYAGFALILSTILANAYLKKKNRLKSAADGNI